MTYGFEADLFLENGPAIHAQRARFARSTRTARAWRQLDAERRLAIVEKMMAEPANENFPDGLPIAL